jgi:cardiolipin synthase (CMP-forming)
MTNLLSQAATIPNIITLVRIILIPMFVMAIVYHHYGYALVFFVIAALSDLLDGWAARLTNQKTKLGAFLDAFADKVLLITSFIVCSVYGWISQWVVICVIGRDLVISIGWFLMTFMSRSTNVGTILSGKIAIASQLILISYVMLSINLSELPDRAPDFAEWIVVALTVFSGFQYIYRGIFQNGK